MVDILEANAGLAKLVCKYHQVHDETIGSAKSETFRFLKSKEKLQDCLIEFIDAYNSCADVLQKN